MAGILDYFDNINIDVAKRKYYNVNKVNAVLEELRDQAVELVDENERLRQALDSQGAASMDAEKMLNSLQTVYRETLDRAHERADEIVREAEEERERVLQQVEKRAAITMKEAESCFGELRRREEQNIRFLNQRLEQLRKQLQNEELPKEPANRAESSPIISAPRPDRTENREITETEEEEEENSVASAQQLQELEHRISLLAREITSLESGQ